jgi:hypothetical protein
MNMQCNGSRGGYQIKANDRENISYDNIPNIEGISKCVPCQLLKMSNLFYERYEIQFRCVYTILLSLLYFSGTILVGTNTTQHKTQHNFSF